MSTDDSNTIKLLTWKQSCQSVPQTCGGIGGGATLANGSRCRLWIGIGAATLIGGWLPNTGKHTYNNTLSLFQVYLR